VFPFLTELKDRLEELDEVLPSMKSLVDVLEYLAVVLVQDAVALLAEGKFKDHPVHELLEHNEVFQ
jgi:hypothetical protein